METNHEEGNATDMEVTGEETGVVVEQQEVKVEITGAVEDLHQTAGRRRPTAEDKNPGRN